MRRVAILTAALTLAVTVTGCAHTVSGAAVRNQGDQPGGLRPGDADQVLLGAGEVGDGEARLFHAGQCGKPMRNPRCQPANRVAQQYGRVERRNLACAYDDPGIPVAKCRAIAGDEAANHFAHTPLPRFEPNGERRALSPGP